MLKLIKTIGGVDGAPCECSKCAAKDFKRSGLGWACTLCGNYHPGDLGKVSLVEIHRQIEEHAKKPFIRFVDYT